MARGFSLSAISLPRTATSMSFMILKLSTAKVPVMIGFLQNRRPM